MSDRITHPRAHQCYAAAAAVVRKGARGREEKGLNSGEVARRGKELAPHHGGPAPPPCEIKGNRARSRGEEPAISGPHTNCFYILTLRARKRSSLAVCMYV